MAFVVTQRAAQCLYSLGEKNLCNLRNLRILNRIDAMAAQGAAFRTAIAAIGTRPTSSRSGLLNALEEETAVIVGHDHWTQQERPREVNDALLRFLRRL